MLSIKKIVFTMITLILFAAFGKTTWAEQCGSFNFPLIQQDSVVFFNCDLGEMQKFDSQGMLSSVPGKENLGGFIRNLLWSPDETKALILSENVSAALQVLKFYSPERELNSLNWWLYDFNTGEARLLDKEIISIGWASSNEVVYNWENRNLSIAKIDSPRFSDYTNLTDITNDSNDLDTAAAPLIAADTVIFPMKRGFYKITPSKREATYHSLSEGLKKIAANPFDKAVFVIQSESSLYKFTAPSESLEIISSPFSAIDLAYVNDNSLAILEKDKQTYSFDLNSAVKNPLPLNISETASGLFSAGNAGEFIFVSGNNIYRKTVTLDSPMLVGKIPESIDRTSTPVPDKIFNIYLIIAPILALFVLIVGFFIYKKYIRQ